MAEVSRDHVTGHYGRAGLASAIRDGLRAAYGERDRFEPAELADLDQLHTLGAAATDRLARLAEVRPGERVLDVGGGLGGAARQLAASFGCRVTLVDITAELCEAAELLNRLTGLQDRVTVRQADVREMDVEAGTVDVAWLQHVAMHVGDKPSLFETLRDALAPGGRLALWEIAAGPAGPPHLPAPWADTPEQSLLVPSDQLRQMLGQAGFRELAWDDLSRDAVRQMARGGSRGGAPAGPGAGLVIDRMAARRVNHFRNLDEGRIAVIMAVVKRP